MSIYHTYLLAMGLALSSPVTGMAQHISDVTEAFANGQKVNAKSEFASFSSVGSSLLMTLPKSYLGRDILMSACVKNTTHYKYAEVGTRPKVLLTYFELSGDKVYLKQRASNIVGDGSNANEQESLSDNNKDYFLAALPLYDNEIGRAHV